MEEKELAFCFSVFLFFVFLGIVDYFEKTHKEGGEEISNLLKISWAEKRGKRSRKETWGRGKGGGGAKVRTRSSSPFFCIVKLILPIPFTGTRSLLVTNSNNCRTCKSSNSLTTSQNHWTNSSSGEQFWYVAVSSSSVTSIIWVPSTNCWSKAGVKSVWTAGGESRVKNPRAKAVYWGRMDWWVRKWM